jgi:hypothetical protein
MVDVVDDVRWRVTRMVSSWHELSQLIEDHSHGEWVFRGVSNVTHRLIPKIGRPQSRKDPATGGVLPFSPEGERHKQSSPVPRSRWTRDALGLALQMADVVHVTVWRMLLAVECPILYCKLTGRPSA